MAKLKLKWDKSQSIRFVRCGASGVYNFSHHADENTLYVISAYSNDQHLLEGYELSLHKGQMNNRDTTELGKFKTSIEAKKFVETLIC